MKTTKPITRTEEVYTCDFCGKDAGPYPTACFGCGKHVCNDLCHLKLKRYEGGGPARAEQRARYLSGCGGIGICLPETYFCPDCNQSDKLALLLRRIETLDANLEKQVGYYRSAHSELARKAERMMEKREAK